ncbi:hypothetical protein BROUX41_004059 [Berkeleyomyces rouxiae]|uniref:uncharacterized protein n=1 Tax=Berkeleyomyces rouxiae TaxID=2035830 RepID=UPI003B784D89
MDEEVLGLNVLVTFHNPPGLQVRGNITKAVPGQSLHLRDVVILGARPSTSASLDISIRDVSNVEVLKAKKPIPTPATDDSSKSAVEPKPAVEPKSAVEPKPAAEPTTTAATKTKKKYNRKKQAHAQAPTVPANAPPTVTTDVQADAQADVPTDPSVKSKAKPEVKPQAIPFVDPAIVSVGRPTTKRPSGEVNDKMKLASKGLPALTTTKGSTPEATVNTSHSGQIIAIPSVAIEMSAVESGPSKPDLQEAEAQEKDEVQEEAETQAPKKATKSHNREVRLARQRRKKEKVKQQKLQKRQEQQQQQEQEQQEQQQQQEQQIQAHTNPDSAHGKGWRNTPLLESTKSFQPFAALKRNSNLAMSGWASEDFTDKNEFDFEGGLAKFDKRSIFEEITKCDTIREDERLVYHNRKAKPGTAGGKNLHHSENVLDMSPLLKTLDDFWNSEADVHIEDRRSNKPSRKNDGKPGLSRQQSMRKSSIIPGVTQPSSRLKEQIVGFYLDPSNRYIDPVSPLQMITLENTAANELGMPEVVLTENAGRGLAEATLHTLHDPAVRHGLGVSNPEHPLSDLIQKCVVLVLAGNNKSGARAIAAARQLRCKGVEVILCVVDLNRDSLLIDAVRHQVRVFRNFGGRVYDKQELFDLYRKAKENGSRIKSTLIIDGLLGLAVPFEELRTGEQTTVYELVHWISKDPGFVISLDIPSGVDPSTGQISIIDGLPLCVKPRYVVSFGAPKKCLAEAISPTFEEELALSATVETLRGTVSDGNEWKLFLVDIGLDTAVWKKAGIKVRHAVDFGGEWMCKMHFRGPAGGSDGDDREAVVVL